MIDNQVTECYNFCIADTAIPASMPELEEWKKLVEMVKRKSRSMSKL